MGHFGFSYIGLIFILLITVPNLFWTKRVPEGYDPQSENRVLRVFERAGQALTTCSALIFSDFNPHEWSRWSWWLIAAFALMLLYEIWWIRYFRSGRKLSDFYIGFLGIPVAGATLPVAGFFLLGVYGRVIWLMISVTILGVGHIGIHLRHKKEIVSRNAAK